nr:PREDICTED: hematopoietic progenitor cell antigen CD34 [Struthio camelus australis]
MLLLGSSKIMKWRQLFWIAFCVVNLLGRAAGNPTHALTSATSAPETGLSSNRMTTDPPSTAKPTLETTTAPGSLATPPTSPALSEGQASPQPSQTYPPPPGNQSEAVNATRGTYPPKDKWPLTAPPATSGQTVVPASTTHRDRVSNVSKSITCHEVKEVRDTEAICLHLKESNTCKHFLEMKGSDLWSVICEESTHRVPSPCQIKLAKSEVDRDCLLLILVGERDPATAMLQESLWEKFGIKSLKRESVRSHQDFSRKTLIALVTSGLLLAFLGLAGYFLMKRRSWSPMGERLGEDPYYMENGSQGNTMITMASHEQPELQEKPNLNGGAQENGTGQASSKTGHSAKQRSVADTEM